MQEWKNSGGTTLASVSSTGKITTTDGITSTGDVVNLNVSSNFNTNINTGTSTGTVTVGSSSASQTVNIGTGIAAATVNIATGDVAGNVNIGDNTGATSSEVLIGGSTTVNGAFNFGIDVFSGDDTYVITLSPIPTDYVAGMMIVFMPGDNNVGACTISVNGLGAIAIKKPKKDDVLQDPGDDEFTAGNIYILVYDGTQFLMINKPL
ncbi:hypothetical protein ES705_38173 [subsurface metagenome]